MSCMTTNIVVDIHKRKMKKDFLQELLSFLGISGIIYYIWEDTDKLQKERKVLVLNYLFFKSQSHFENRCMLLRKLHLQL